MMRSFALCTLIFGHLFTPIADRAFGGIYRESGTDHRSNRQKAFFGSIKNIPAWQSYKHNFVSDQGRVIDTGNGNISHSEGQGFGMLLAVAADDRATFKRLWAWTRTKLIVRPQDALAAWRWSPDAKTAISDLNNATDGDILIAWALVEADRAWPNEGYRHDARRIIDDIAAHAVLWRSKGGSLLLPGVVGFSAKDHEDGPVINLSYWVFPAFPRFGTVTSSLDWARLDRSGLVLLHHARFGAAMLPTEWITMGSGVPKPAPDFPPTFSYNAIRVPLYLALAGDTERSDYAPFAKAWTATPINKLPIVNTETGHAEGWLEEPGYSAVAELTICAASGKPVSRAFLRPSESQNYYPSTLHLFAIIAAKTKFPTCISP